jgi:hypothetical protein
LKKNEQGNPCFVNGHDTPPFHGCAGASSLLSYLSIHHAYTVSKVCVCPKWSLYKAFVVHRIVTIVVVVS